MIINYFSLYDDVAAKFKNPVPFANDADAIRAFCDAVRRCDETPQDGFYHKDLAMYRVGTFDDGTGVFKSDVKRLADYLSAKQTVIEEKENE